MSDLNWSRYIRITPNNRETTRIKLSIVMGLAGPALVMQIDDGRGVTLASRWQDYTADHSQGLFKAIADGIEALKKG